MGLSKKVKSNTIAGCSLLFMCIIYHLIVTWFSQQVFQDTVSAIVRKRTENGFRLDSMLTAHFVSNSTSKIKCHRTNKFYDLCLVNSPIVMDPRTATFYIKDGDIPHVMEKIKPYPRKWEHGTMRDVKEIKIVSDLKTPKCDIKHNVPAMVFSAGNYISFGGIGGNFFHEFNDGMVPLFITVNSVFFDDQDFVFVVTDASNSWFNQFSELLTAYTKHSIINLDNGTSTHCFVSAAMGLVTHGFMTIRPKLMPMSQTVFDLRAFFDKAFNKGPQFKPKSGSKKPRLILTRRRGGVGRVLWNHDELKKMTQEVGFEVIVFQPSAKSSMRESYKVINSSHAMIGVHGAALTHELFLRPKAVFLQVVPLGVDIGAEIFFGDYARAIGLNYVEYKISAEESSLINKYDRDSQLIRDPIAYLEEHRSVATNDLYFKEQDVKLDLSRFKKYLIEAYQNAKTFMEKEG